ncbi:RnfABCDGE type electron transport complex subunit D [bacterium]|nr:RnfABCDGE type electron transport complex subunit D [bacterium]RQV95990.1 MAG: RnfABCDGE type electron transport complex subunit D [bacterium]
MEQPFLISPAPHIKDTDSIRKIMFWVIISLLPAGLGAVYFFGIRVIWITVASIISAVITELICQVSMKRSIRITDGSAIITGILLAYNLPPEVPLWLPIIGSFVAILIGKMVFGGIGYNPMNPALIGRAFLTASWPAHMTVFQTLPRNGTLSGIDSISSATPLNLFSETREILLHTSNYTTEQVTEATQAISELYSTHSDLFIGRIGGCIGETSVVLLLMGAVFLMYKRIIGWKIPFTYLGTVAILTYIFGGTEGLLTGDPIFHLFSGGLILGAFFMATDMVTTPVTFKGRLFFGTGCGIITVIIRLWGGYPEGVSYSILLMNLTTPLLDKYTKPKIFGGK